MKAWSIAIIALAGVVSAAAPAGAQPPLHFSLAAGLSEPIGDLGSSSNLGFNLDLRGESGTTRVWGWRGDISWDRFGGKGAADSYSYLGFAGNILYRASGQLYEFGGFGIYDEHIAYERPQVSVDAASLGLQFGVGYNFARSTGTNTFVEIGLTNVFATRGNETWVPVRFGVRF
jgi:hypothetical protein